MTRSVYITASERQVSKSAVAVGLIDLFAGQVQSVGFFRPLVQSTENDPLTTTLLQQKGVTTTFEQAVGVSLAEYSEDPAAAMDVIVDKYSAVAESCDTVVIVGSDFTDQATPSELDHNALIAANLNSPVIYVCRADHRDVEHVRRNVDGALDVLEARHNSVAAIVLTHAAPEDVDALRAGVAEVRDVPVYVMAADPVIWAPSVAQQMAEVDARLIAGREEFLQRESLQTVVAGMTLPNLLDHLGRECTVLVPSDRTDLLPGLLMAHESSEFGPLAGIILIGGFDVPESINRLLGGSQVDLPIGITDQDTFTSASALKALHGPATSSARKLEAVRSLFAAGINGQELSEALEVPRTEIRTPTMFEHQLMQMARSDRRKIVLPEASDDRILQAAAVVLQRGVADLILLGDPAVISRRASELGINLSGAEVVSPENPELVERFANEYAQLRAHKGVTVEQAREKLTNLSYFATMMVHLGMADGMVSGAVNTTADTIRPSLEFIKTKPGVSVVSGAFLMAMSDRVLVYADCAVNPDPTTEQLADIAVSSVETAKAFAVDPRVAMLSYSTGDSGSGEDVDKVREATRIVREKDPELKVEGPIQFDAAVDATVAAKKMPDSEVAGKATVFIFPDLNTGNNTYKAVQRTSGAVAIGPVLQGLKKPVNDLSRGALVDDIVSTIVITAIQAQQEA